MVYRRTVRKNMIPGLVVLSDGIPRRTVELGLSPGARTGVQGINNSFSNLGSKGKVARAIVPPELCLEIIKHCEEKL